MVLAIATNSSALMASAAASSVNKDMETSMERLATGKRINSAADDAAGVAIASRLDAEIRGTNQAIRNAQDAQGLIDTAEGAHKEVENILQRMREVAVQAANDTNSADDRTSLQAEMTQLTEEIDRIAATTTWAGISLLNGGSSAGSVNSVADTAQTFNFQIATNTAGSGDTMSISIKDIGALSLGIDGTSTTPTFAAESVDTDNTTTDLTISTSGNTITIGGTATGGDGVVSLTIDGNAVSVDFSAGSFTADAAGQSAALTQAIEDAGISGVTVTDNGDGTVDVTRSGSVSVASNSAAQTAIGNIDAAITELNEQRASLGAYSNRLDSTVSNLTNISANLEGGKGRIEDADFAAESTNLAKSQILQQASTAMLAQANASKQGVLSLLQG
ncbi:flagellin [Thalassobacter stenotrophicus DSM 16310]|uniref:Flagellin n=1 Tax=Thalassobacter stenotrophicus DSM 16310 TaxID=1123361 RepID=A0ABY1IH80_9RHOB|nr:flagellin [Thalassobacter stenotrophicus]SHJ16927.1 flagellin [Thalassobacter stenotrophicus DSM 16310]